MKLKGTWITICLILAVGALSTDFVKKQTGNGGPAEAGAQTEAVKEAGLPAQEAGGRLPAQALMGDEAADAGPPVQAERTGLPEEIVSSGRLSTELEGADGENGVLLRLMELDGQIAKNHTEEKDITANSRKAAAESERKMWEGEVQYILGVLKERLDTAQQEELMLQQKGWMKDRESQAIAASRKQAGGSLEELNYSMALAEITRQRAFELAEGYSSFLAD
ncbi:MAG: DUF1311 domain-containing protein [Lachnospiraceae bacterium]|nr:DUF1311 domain-containing protein [Lachnospiraceae bacterium]